VLTIIDAESCVGTRAASMMERTPPAGTDVCAAADVIDGKSRVVNFGRDRPELIVVREGARVFGYLNECAHMAVALNLLDDYGVETARGRMICDHHYAAFRFADGYCVEGPCAGESLVAVPLAIRGDRIVIGGVTR
jgi:nitrite reductase/ring-hydroxylating ferredoxin subunit